MLREAAYLGVPALSIFRGDIGAVDRMLEYARVRSELSLERTSWTPSIGQTFSVRRASLIIPTWSTS